MGRVFESTKAGQTEAIAHAKNDKGAAPVRVYRPQAVDVKGLRQRVGMTQEQFAARFGFSVAILRHRERGARAPAGPALVLLNVIGKDASAVLRALVA